MAINLKEYDKIDKGLRMHKKDYTRLLFDTVELVEGKQKRKRKTAKVAARAGWSRRDYVKEAKRLFIEYRDGVAAGLDDSATVGDLVQAYFDSEKATEWRKIQRYTYDKHIAAAIGKVKAVNVTRSHIDRIIKKMRDSGAKPRTQKLVLNVLRPAFDYAMQNGIIRENPTRFITIKLPKTKKPVVNATDTFKRLWDAVNELYANDPFHLAAFRFILLHGRRKSEVFGMRWENIDLTGRRYTIEATKSGEDQTYTLPDLIAEPLEKLPRDSSGWVFPSPTKEGEHIHDIRTQTAKVRERSGVEAFTLHYGRNVLVSMLAEQGVEAIFLSGTLGHSDANTINKYLSMPRQKASEATADVIEAVLG